MALKKSLFIFSSLLALAACVPSAPTNQNKVQRDIAPAEPIIEKPAEDLSRGAIPADARSIKVALLIPLSGEAAPIGNAMFDAATLALYDSYLNVPSDQIRAQLILIPKDTGVTTAETVKAAKQVVEQGASFVIGPLFSQSVTAIKPVLKDKNITMVSFSNNKAVASPNSYTFGFLPEQQVERIAEYAYLSNLQRVALLAPNDAYGEKVRDSLSEIYLKKGGQVTSAELYAPSQNNIDAAVARIAGAYNNSPEDRRFQAMFIADSGNQIRNILKAIHKNNLNLKKIKLLGTGLWDDEGLAKIPDMHGAWFPSSPPEMFNNFQNRFAATYGYKPVRLAGLAYDAVTIAAQIAMSGNGINTGALTDPKGFNTPADGLVRLLPSGISDRKLAIMEITPQGFRVIDPAQKNFSEQ
jgi:ABC-type branched-subunit amino acid transport system substrate-binding protein